MFCFWSARETDEGDTILLLLLITVERNSGGGGILVIKDSKSRYHLSRFEGWAVGRWWGLGQ